jgi:putative peptide zinc metalloprotease protein
MTSMAESLVNSASRPLRIRKRPDLEARRHRYHGKSYWVVKEPVGLNYFRFHEEEYAILNMLDGETSLQTIKEEFQKQFAPQRITLQDLQQFVGMLHRSGLVISQMNGQGQQLRRRGDQRRRKELLGKVANVFALRFRGIDPERLLNRLLPWFGWLFTPGALIGTACLALSALMLVLLQLKQFQAKLPTFEQFFAADNWIWLGLTMAVVKILHEFGHGLSCKKFGGECHEMGLMLLVFTPCLYCNVSDSWMLPNKWQRVFIGAAGMYVELILASLATFVWWYSDPGFVNYLALAVVFICSVSTVIFNGNPLLRFDGYYILMDILEIPNLRQKSTEVLKRWFQSVCLGLELQENPFLPQRNKFWFGAFTVAAGIYRWVVVIGIFMFLNKVLEPYGLKRLGQIAAFSGIIGMFVPPIMSTYKFFKTPGKASKMKRSRVLSTVAVAVAAIGIVAFVPFPFHIDSAVELQPTDAHSVYAMVPGRVVNWHKKPGDHVEADELIATLDNIDLRLKEISYRGEFNVAELRLKMMEKQGIQDSEITAQVGAQREVRDAAQQKLLNIQDRTKRLEVRSPVSGTILPPPAKEEAKDGTERLPVWSGNPFDAENEGAFFAETDLLCLVGDTKRMEAVLVIDQADIDLVVPGHEVDIKLDSSRLETIAGKISQISEAEMEVASPNMTSQTGGRLNSTMDESGQLRPTSTSYQARVPLDEYSQSLRPGYRGQARVYVGWKSLGWRLYRFLSRTFHFDL